MVDIKEYFYPHSACKHYGLRNQGNIVKSGTYTVKGEKKQMLHAKYVKHVFQKPEILYSSILMIVLKRSEK